MGGPGTELARLRDGGGRASPELCRSLAERGHDAEDLTAAQAAAWLGVWQHEMNNDRAHALPGRLAGPGLRADPIHATVQGGRLRRRNRRALARVQDRLGQDLTRPQEIERALWEGREATWASVPDLPPAARVILDHYFRDDRRRAGAVQPPSRGRLLGLVLAQGGSAPCWDGIPYEALAQGAHFVAELLAQAFIAAGQSAEALRAALGEATGAPTGSRMPWRSWRHAAGRHPSGMSTSSSVASSWSGMLLLCLAWSPAPPIITGCR